MCEKIDGFMPDSVTKNLDVVGFVAEKLYSPHMPPHLLCVSHTNEKTDRACIDVLSDIERKVGLGRKGSQSIVQCTIVAFCKLISYSPSSLEDEYDVMMQKKGGQRTIFMYTER